MDNKHLIKPNTVFENVKRFSGVMEVTLDQFFFFGEKIHLPSTFIYQIYLDKLLYVTL